MVKILFKEQTELFFYIINKNLIRKIVKYYE
jgi:hypothetical protein